MENITAVKEKSERIMSVEWLRGIASLGVCEMHAFCALDFFSKNDTFFQTYIFPLSITGRLGVPIFFVISGFIIPYSMWKRNYKLKNFFNFLIRRLTRLEPPYLLTIVLALIVAFITTKILTGKDYILDWKNLVMHIGYLNVFTDNRWLNPVFWTLAVEFQYYILIGLSFPLMMGTAHWKTVMLWVISIGCAAFSYYHPVNHFIFIHFQIFILGILCFKKHAGMISVISFSIQAILTCGIIYYFHGKAYVASGLLTALIILFNYNLKSSFVHYLGKISYSLYLVHWVIGIELFRNLFVHYYPDSSQNVKLVVATLITILCVLISGLFYNIIEKPSIRWSKAVPAPKG